MGEGLRGMAKKGKAWERGDKVRDYITMLQTLVQAQGDISGGD